MKLSIHIYYVVYTERLPNIVFFSWSWRLEYHMIIMLQRHVKILILTQIISKLIGFFSKNFFSQAWKLNDSEYDKKQKQQQNPHFQFWTDWHFIFQLSSTIRSEIQKFPILETNSSMKKNKVSLIQCLVFSCSFAPLESLNHGRTMVERF
jgi:hypothetical protein